MNFLTQVEQLKLATGVAERREATDELSNSRTVDVVDLSQVENDLLFAFGDELVDFVSEFADFFSQNNAALHVEDGDVRDFASFDGQRHECGYGGRWPEW